jgi:hypothetical protein
MTLFLCYVTLDVEQIPNLTSPWTTKSRATDAYGAERPDDLAARSPWKAYIRTATQWRQA